MFAKTFVSQGQNESRSRASSTSHGTDQSWPGRFSTPRRAGLSRDTDQSGNLKSSCRPTRNPQAQRGSESAARFATYAQHIGGGAIGDRD
jgi:hypothetical protein